MGLPQGSILGPLLFSYISMIYQIVVRKLNVSNMQMAVIYVSAKTPQLAAYTLTNKMTGVSQWLQITVDLELFKMVSMCFSFRTKEINGFIIKINQKAIETINSFKYLGVILDSQLKFDVHVKRLCRTIRPNLNCFYMIRPNTSL